MARRKGFVGLINQIAREQARAERQAIAEYNRQVREEKRQLRELERLERQVVREQKQYEKELKQLYLEERQLETIQLNEDLNESVETLSTILEHTLSIDDTIAFDSLRIKDDFRPITIPRKLATPTIEPRRKDFFRQTATKPVGFLEKFLHGEDGKNGRIVSQQQADTDNTNAAFQRAHSTWQKLEQERISEVKSLREEYDSARNAFLSKMNQRNADVDELEQSYFDGDKEAIITYNTMVLEKSEYPEGFPQEFRVAYVPESKELVIDYEMPTREIVPSVESYRFIKTHDEIRPKNRKVMETKSLYQDLVASLSLRTIHEVFEADQQNHLSVVSFNGFVNTVDPATGQDIKPYLVSVRVVKDRFLEIDLSRIDKKACLRNLGANVSSRPDECLPIKPIVDMNMVDKRFVENSDVLSDLESRPNLMELDPFEFENLVGNLFTQMGLDTKQTRTSRDGGVDAVAFDSRPVLGGKVVIQAKRYKNTVGVAAVRDLYGTMLNEGASKGILVTTAGYGKAAFDFAMDKPIELIDGGGLLYLLEHHANTRARILMPED